MPSILSWAAFVAGAAISMGASIVLVTRLERVGERIGLSEASLGLVAALAADAPEVTAAVTAIAKHEQQVGAGVVLGSNVFNLAALLGLGAAVAGWIGLHRKVLLLAGAVAVWVAAICVLVVAGLIPAGAGLALTSLALVLYVALVGSRGRGTWLVSLPARWTAWLRSAISEEELELQEAIRPRPARWTDVVASVAALIVVVLASITMELSASALGSRYAVPQIVVGGLVLAAVTSMPNAVAAVYLAARGRGAATLSTALNSNAINVVVGLLLPATVIGLAEVSAPAVLTVLWYAIMTITMLALAYRDRGLHRRSGILILLLYTAFTGSVLAIGYSAVAPGFTIAASLGLLAIMGMTGYAVTLRRDIQLSQATPSAARPPDSGTPAGAVASGGENSLLGQRAQAPGWSVRRLCRAALASSVAAAYIDRIGRRLRR